MENLQKCHSFLLILLVSVLAFLPLKAFADFEVVLGALGNKNQASQESLVWAEKLQLILERTYNISSKVLQEETFRQKGWRNAINSNEDAIFLGLLPLQDFQLDPQDPRVIFLAPPGPIHHGYLIPFSKAHGEASSDTWYLATLLQESLQKIEPKTDIYSPPWVLEKLLGLLRPSVLVELPAGAHAAPEEFLVYLASGIDRYANAVKNAQP